MVMVYRLTGIKIDIDKDGAGLTGELARRLSVQPKEIQEYRVVRKSLDARDKDRLFYVYTVDITLSPKGAKAVARRKIPELTMRPAEPGIRLVPGNDILKQRPVVVGAGPAGIFAALVLARHGYRPLLLERGQDVDTRAADLQQFWFDRILNPESNVQFGEGGAGTFSDGKLTTRINDPRVQAILKDFVRAGAPEEILYLNKPHIGTDKLRIVVKNLRTLVLELGGEIYFGSRVSSLLVENGRVTGVIINDDIHVAADVVVLAVGHSARDTYEMLELAGCPVEQKAFAIGVRVEHPQEVIDTAQYGAFAGHPALGAADYQLVNKERGTNRPAYTFCMCPGGQVVAAASEKDTVVTNGMSDYARDSGVANSAIVAAVGPDDFMSAHPLAGVEFQRKWEKAAFVIGGRNYNAPAQLTGDFLAGSPSTGLEAAPWATYKPGLEPADLHECLPGYVSSALEEAIVSFERKLKGFSMPDSVLTGVETRTSAPVRLVRGTGLESTGIGGLYPAGEGAGYAGGIVSAAVDGMRAAEAVISSYGKGEL